MSEPATPESVGRNHWHHFRLEADNVQRCAYCPMTMDEFAATKNLQETHGQKEAAKTA